MLLSKFLVSVLFVLAYSHAEVFEFQEWRFKSEVKSFVFIEDEGIYITLSCVLFLGKVPEIKPHCLSKLNEMKASVSKLDSSKLKNGKNPGAVACRELYDGRVRFAENINGDQKTFCEFSEKFLIDNLWITKIYAKSKN